MWRQRWMKSEAIDLLPTSRQLRRARTINWSMWRPWNEWLPRDQLASSNLEECMHGSWCHHRRLASCRTQKTMDIISTTSSCSLLCRRVFITTTASNLTPELANNVMPLQTRHQNVQSAQWYHSSSRSSTAVLVCSFSACIYLLAQKTIWRERMVYAMQMDNATLSDQTIFARMEDAGT